MINGTELPASLNDNLVLHTALVSSHLMKAVVEVPPSLVKIIRDQTLSLYQQRINQPGFALFNVPHSYIEEHYKPEIFTSISGFLFTHFVLDFLLKELVHRKILSVNLPRLKNVDINSDYCARFNFEISLANPLKLKEWKHFVFKSPKRKNYKDLDKQVTLFIKKENSLFKKLDVEKVENGDWVFFEAILLDEKGSTVSGHFKNTFWMKVNTQHIAHPLPALLIDKKVGDSIITDHLVLEESFQEKTNNRYSFQVTVKGITKGNHLSLDMFRTNFKLKNKTDIHRKLIEVFSYRNDLSQRKSIIEEIFHLFFSKHRFEVPKHIVLRKQEDILSTLLRLPDYQVYKLQKDFFRQVELLAEKQLKEEILIDQIAYNDNILVDEKDIEAYLNLFNNERLKEFVYFKPTIEGIDESVTPIHPCILYQSTLREKTLNHIIHTLTK